MNYIVKKGVRLVDFFREEKLQDTSPNFIIAASVDGVLCGLDYTLPKDSTVIPIRVLDRIGYSIYTKSLIFLTVVAAKLLYPESKVFFEHSMNNEIYFKLFHDRDASKEEVEALEEKMKEIVELDPPIEKYVMDKSHAITLFREEGYRDLENLLKYISDEYVEVYECMGVFDYLSYNVVPSMGYLKYFDLEEYEGGVVLLLPERKNFEKISTFREMPKLRKTFEESKSWAKILNLSTLSDINDLISKDGRDYRDMILVAEGLHERKIADIADEIAKEYPEKNIVLIAGPSSSGKTTTANRLSIQLRVLGFNPKRISADDYFKTRWDEEGNEIKMDLESIDTIDLELLNNHLTQLLMGEEIETVEFDFVKQVNHKTGKTYRMEENTILIVEGIHGLNDKMTYAIPRSRKFKLYVSALTNLNIDAHNTIYPADVRLLRRMIRDDRTRGFLAEDTILHWPKVRDGEEKNIFPYQEEADIMFNSSLIYEINILRRHTEPILRSIPLGSEAYIEAQRMLKFLNAFQFGSESVIPPNSILREFIGRSAFGGV